jgi:protein-tyrosine-phosphatase
LEAAKKLGLDLGDHVSQLITPEMASWAELVVIMDPSHAKVLTTKFGVDSSRIVVLGDLDPGSPPRRVIQDPIDRPESFFLRTYERIDRCMAELLHLVRRIY